MTVSVMTVSGDTVLHEALELMRQKRLSSIVVLNQQSPAGIFTERDVLRLASIDVDKSKASVSQYMSSPLLMASEDMDYRDGYNFMMDNQVRHLVVIDESEHLSGIISETDFLYHINQEFLMRFKDVSAVMEKKVATLPLNSTSADAVQLMSEGHHSCVVVVENQIPQGIITERDFVRLELESDSLEQKSLTDIMSSPVLTIPKDTLLPEAMSAMELCKVRHLIITNNSEVIVGMISHHEIVRQMYDHQIEELMAFLHTQERELIQTKDELESERKLRCTEARLDLLLNTLPHGILECDSQGIITYSNSAYHALMGLEPDEITSRPVWEMYASTDDQIEVQQYFKYLLEEQPLPTPYTAKHYKSDGQNLLLTVVWDYQRDNTGQLTGLISVISDITKQSQSEQISLNRAIEMEQVFEAMPIAMVYADVSRRIQRVNPAFTAMFGYELREVINKETSVLYSSFDDFLEQGVQRFNSDGKGSKESYQIHYQRKNGEVFFGKTVGTTVRDNNAQVVGMLGLIEDITEYKKAEEYRRLSAQVIDNTSEGVMITDAEGTIVEVNNSFLTITGYTQDEVIGKNPRVLSSGYHDHSFYRKMWSSLQHTGQWKGEIWNRRKDGSIFPELQHVNAVKDEKSTITHFVSIFSDISKDKKTQEEIDYLAHYDPITKLPNRLMLNARLEQAISRARISDKHVGVIFIGIDRFKYINDSFGYHLGDDVLKRIAERLQASLGDNYFAARIGGDEYVLLAEDLKEVEQISLVVQKAFEVFKKPIGISEREVQLSASLGVCVYPNDGEEKSLLLRNADSAMYQAKKEGRNTYRFYTPELTENAMGQIVLENHLRTAIQRNELQLYFQPQVALETQVVVGYEALLRWFSPELGRVPPDKFIPIAEEFGLILTIGEWVLEKACNQAKAWVNAGYEFGRIAVNVAGLQIEQGNLVDMVKRILNENELPAKYLELEITESFIMEHADKTIEQLQELKALGVCIAIDDFGTGYSSLSYLKQLPVDKLKIDRSFVTDLPNDANSNAIAHAIVALAKSMGLTVIAEGVETSEQSMYLMDIGCQQVQGYLYGRPEHPSNLFNT